LAAGQLVHDLLRLRIAASAQDCRPADAHDAPLTGCCAGIPDGDWAGLSRRLARPWLNPRAIGRAPPR
jgi:hypothetical protein